MAIYEVHRTDPHNIGDAYCNPSKYFDLPLKRTVDIFNKKWLPNKDDTVIIGGGGLIRRTFQKQIIKYKDTGAKLIFWGIGHNFRMKETHMWWPEWVTSAKLWSVRDYKKMKYYVPCVSCMHPAFDKKRTSVRKEVYFIHAHRNRNENYATLYGNNIMSNDQQDFEKVISFLGSGETVITDSFHGAYWAMLLGKKVKVVNWTTKFINFEHQPEFIQSIKDPSTLRLSAYKDEYDQYLDNCRTRNKDFYKKVIAELNS